ncbi:MAG TPA: glycosyltransferase family 2 protein, partial [Candidatus Paceibacterota bacterium]
MHEISGTKEIVSVIIPAFNEGQTIGSIVSTALSHPLVKEVIVVDDGSWDDTVAVARAAGASVAVHRRNQGKAAAMDTGVGKASADVIFFIDADIVGFTHKMMNDAIS